MACLLIFKHFCANGHILEAGQVTLPSSLDWLDIDVKVHYYKLRGVGNPETKYALLESQGQQRLVVDVSLEKKDYRTLKENEDGIQSQVDQFIADGGYSRTPRNQ